MVLLFCYYTANDSCSSVAAHTRERCVSSQFHSVRPHSRHYLNTGSLAAARIRKISSSVSCSAVCMRCFTVPIHLLISGTPAPWLVFAAPSSYQFIYFLHFEPKFYSLTRSHSPAHSLTVSIIFSLPLLGILIGHQPPLLQRSSVQGTVELVDTPI